MANIEVSIKIDVKPTDAGRSPDKMAEQTERGCFRLVLDEAAERDIDALEDGLLRTCYPALRDALAQPLEDDGGVEEQKAQRGDPVTEPAASARRYRTPWRESSMPAGGLPSAVAARTRCWALCRRVC